MPSLLLLFLLVPPWPLTFTLPLSLAPEPVGSVSKLQILNASSDVLRVTWVGVPGATSYKLAWGRSEGKAPGFHPCPSWLQVPSLLSSPQPP